MEEDDLEQEEGTPETSTDGQATQQVTGENNPMPWELDWGGTQAHAQAIDESIPPWEMKWGEEKSAPESESAAGAFLRGAAHAAAPAVGSLPAIGTGAEIGAGLGALAAPVTGGFSIPAGAFIGGALGALGAGWALSSLQEWVLGKMGWDDSAQRAANEEEHPYASMAGELAPNVAAFNPGKLADSLASRLLGGGAMAGLEAGQELSQGEFDPGKVAMAGAFGAVFNRETGFGRKAIGAGVPAGARVNEALPAGAQERLRTYREAQENPTPQEQQDKEDATPYRTTGGSIGTAAEHAPPSQDVTGVGNNSGERDGGNDGRWAKRRDRMMNAPESEDMVELREGEVAPDIKEAINPTRQPDEGAQPTEQSPPIQNANTQNTNEAQQPQNLPATREPPPAPPPQPPAWDQPFRGEVYSPELGRMINTTHDADVPYLAGPNKTGDTVHFDVRVPDQINVGTPEEPKILNPKAPTMVHEIVEQIAHQRIENDPRSASMSREEIYQKSHEIAEKAEEHALRLRGFTPEQIKRYNGFMDALAKKTEAERAPDRYPPPDLWTKPYPVKEAQALQQEGRRINPLDEQEAIDLHRAAREAPARVQEKMAAQQTGELFSPEAARYDQPNAHTDRVPDRPAHARPEQGAGQATEPSPPTANREATPGPRPQPRPEAPSLPEPVKAQQDLASEAPRKPRVLQDLRTPEEIAGARPREPIDDAIQIARDNKMERMLPVLEHAKATGGPEMQKLVGERFIKQWQEMQTKGETTVTDHDLAGAKDVTPNKSGGVGEEPAPRNNKKTGAERGSTVQSNMEIKDREGNHVGYAKSEPIARKRSRSLSVAADTMDKYGPQFEKAAETFNPKNPESGRQIRELAREVLQSAKDNAWTKYMPEQPHPAALWMDELEAFGGRPHQNKETGEIEYRPGRREGKIYPPAEFLTREKLLRSGNPEAVQDVVGDRKEQGERAMRRGPSLEDAERINAKIDPMTDARQGDGERKGFTVGDLQRIAKNAEKTENMKTALGALNLKSDYRDVMDHISSLDPSVPVHTLSHEDMDNIAKLTGTGKILGFYESNSHAIYMRPDADPQTYMHEAVHAVTSRRVESNPKMREIIRTVMDSIDGRPGVSLREIFPHAMENEQEFLAYGMTNPEFRDTLASIQVSPNIVRALGLQDYGYGKIKNAFQAFAQAIRKILGLGPKEYNALEAVINLTDRTTQLHDSYRGGKRADARIDAIQQVRNNADDLLKQKRPPFFLRFRDMDKLAEAVDHLFGGPEKNPFRKIHDAIERSRMSTLNYDKEADGLRQRSLELRDKYKGTDIWERAQELMHDESKYQRYADLPLNRQGFRTTGANEQWANSKHPDLEQRFNALPDDIKDFRADWYDFAEKRHDKLAMESAAARMMKLLGVKDDNIIRKAIDGTPLTNAEFDTLGTDDRIRQANLELLNEAGSIAKVPGPYVPFIRRGKFATTGLFKTVDPSNALRQLDENTHEFKSKSDAVDFAEQQHGRPHVSSYYVDNTTGERFTQRQTPVTSEGKPVFDENGNPRTYQKEVALSKNDPNVEQRWKVKVDKGYLRMHETYRDALAHEKFMRDSGVFEKSDVQKKKYQPHTDPLALASALNIESKLKSNPIYENLGEPEKAAVKHLMAEHFLTMQSATRIQNSRLHRNYVPGADEDLIRNIHDYSHDTSARLGRMEHQQAIDDAIKSAEKTISTDKTKSNAVVQTLNEFKERLDHMKDDFYSVAAGQMGPIQHRIMNISYLARLATPGFTIRNLTQLPMMGLAEVGGKHGFGATFREMMNVYKDIGAGKVLGTGLKETGKAIKGSNTKPATIIEDIRNRLGNPREKELIDNLSAGGHVDPDAGFQMSEHEMTPGGNKLNFFNARKETPLIKGSEKALNIADKALHWMDEVSRQMPRAAEAINRTGTGILAHRMEFKAQKRLGKTDDEAHAAAMSYAGDAVNNTQFRYSDTNKPTWQRNPWARAAFQFKQFGKSVYEYMGRHIGNVISEDTDAATKKASLKSLGGLFVTHTIMAGALGLPWEPVRALLIGAKQAGFSNTEWDDVENSIREHLAAFGGLAGLNETNRKKLGEALARGLPRLLGMDLSPGLGIDNMLLFSSPRSGTERDMDANLSAWLFQMIAGAPAGLALQYVHGLRDMSNGDYASGIERLSPLKIGSDLLKAEEGYRHGKTNARGRETFAPYSPLEAGYKAMGIPVGREAEQNEYAHQVYQKGLEIKDAKSKAIAAWIKADNPADKQAAFQKARDAGLTAADLQKSYNAEQSNRRKNIVNHVQVTKDTRPIAQRLKGVYNTGDGGE